MLPIASFNRISADFPYLLPVAGAPWSPDGDGRLSPFCKTIIAAARNEDTSIGPALTSLLALRYPFFEIIAVNDRSSDGTGDVMKELAKSLPQLRVCDIAERCFCCRNMPDVPGFPFIWGLEPST